MNTSLATAQQEIAWSTLRISGEDAQNFLQGQVSQDVELASAGTWTFVLQPDSEVVALGWLYIEGSDYCLDVLSEVAEATKMRLKKFALRIDVTISIEETLRPRLDTVGAAFDVGFPVFNGVENTTPHSFGGTWIQRAVSFSKGCYTGQELVGRLDARNAPVPFRISRFIAPSRQDVDAFLANGPHAERQKLINAFSRGGAICGFALVHRSAVADRSSSEAEDILDLTATNS